VRFFIDAMRESDISRVQEIERQSFSTPWSAATYQRELRAADQCRYIVARERPSRPIPSHQEVSPRRGWLASVLPGLFGSASMSSPYIVAAYGGVWVTLDEGHITTIATAPEYRRRGVGELVLNGIIDAAAELGGSVLTLEVRVSNLPAQSLYLKYGFEARGTRRRYYTDNNEDALIMWAGPIDTPTYQRRLQQLRVVLSERMSSTAGTADSQVDRG
jgi:[ribosomal protein S18]-alanine N-acetyltransferase